MPHPQPQSPNLQNKPNPPPPFHPHPAKPKHPTPQHSQPHSPLPAPPRIKSPKIICHLARETRLIRGLYLAEFILISFLRSTTPGIEVVSTVWVGVYHKWSAGGGGEVDLRVKGGIWDICKIGMAIFGHVFWECDFRRFFFWIWTS